MFLHVVNQVPNGLLSDIFRETALFINNDYNTRNDYPNYNRIQIVPNTRSLKTGILNYFEDIVIRFDSVKEKKMYFSLKQLFKK